MDAKYIKGMLNEPDLQPNAAINRWIQGILMFDFALQHIPAERHQAPDTLSRRPQSNSDVIESDDDSSLDEVALLIHIPQEQISPYQISKPPYNDPEATFLPSCLASRIQQEKLLDQIYQFLSDLKLPEFGSPQKTRHFISKATEFYIDQKTRVMYKKNGNKPPLLVIQDPNRKLSILKHAHEQMGHRGVATVLELIRPRFYWPHLRTDVHHHVKSCHECQIRSLKRMEVPVTISTPVTLFSKLFVDMMHMPKAKNMQWIIAARDDLSGTCEARAIPNKNADTVAKFFWEQIYCRYGAPRRVITDNGSEVKGAFSEILKRLQIPQLNITAYNHHGNGLVERGHFTLRESLLKACKGKITKWPDYLPEALFADRVTTSRVTGFSPYQLLHGTDPVLPFDLLEATFLVTGYHPGMSTIELLALRIQQLCKRPADIEKAAQTLHKARFASKEHFEKQFQTKLIRTEFKPGDLVLVRNTPIETSHDRKPYPRYLGPFQVVQKGKGKSYIMREMDGATLGSSIATYRIIPYITREHKFMRENERLESPEADLRDARLKEIVSNESEASTSTSQIHIPGESSGGDI